MTTNITTADFIHPELQNGEVFFRNLSSDAFMKMEWGTKRKGKIAYDGNGNLLRTEDWFPVFLKEKELVDMHTDLSSLRKKFKDLQK